MNPLSPFPLIDEYTSIRLGVDIVHVRVGDVAVVESLRRTAREMSYGFVHVLWWAEVRGRGSVISVPPGAARTIREALRDAVEPLLSNQVLTEEIRSRMAYFLPMGGQTRCFRDLVFACGVANLRDVSLFEPAVRLIDPTLQTAEGIRLPSHCFPDGIVCGVLRDGKVVSVAYAHRTGVMEDRVADLAVETSPAYRRRGYGKAVVAEIVRDFCERGGEARYGCSPDNHASIATARAVGFVPYAESLIFAAP